MTLTYSNQPRQVSMPTGSALRTCAGYEPIGREIADELGPEIAVFVSAVGTGAALMGVADGLAAQGANPRIIALEPQQSPLLTTGLNVVVAIDLSREIGPDKRVVTLACDTRSKYLGGHIFN